MQPLNCKSDVLTITPPSRRAVKYAVKGAVVILEKEEKGFGLERAREGRAVKGREYKEGNGREENVSGTTGIPTSRKS